MLEQITERRGEIERLCREFRVRRLAVFGSAIRDDFDPEKSDIDFLVEFEELHWNEYWKIYSGLLQGLTELFSRKVDLVISKNLLNPYIRRAVEASQQELYAA